MSAPEKKRCGMQLLELTVSLAIAGILMAGLSGSIIIANQSMKVATTHQAASSKTQSGLDRLRYDLAESFRTSDRTATSVTLSVADRNNDTIRESVQYRWSGGVGTPLQRLENSGSWTDITDNLNAFQLNWRNSRPLPPRATALDPAGACVYQTCTTAFGIIGGSLSIPVPATYRSGDLVIAAVAISGRANNLSSSAGWQTGPQRSNPPGVTLATFYSLAPPTTSLSVNWSGQRASHGVIAHFTTPAGAGVLFDGQSEAGGSSSPPAPAASATANNALVVRALAGNGLQIFEEACNMPGHISIAMRQNLVLDPLVGLTYCYVGPGSVPQAMFNLGGSTNYVTATLVFQP